MAELETAMRKPSLREMLAEPIVRTVMARDGVRERDVVTVLTKARLGMTGVKLSLARPAARARTHGCLEPRQWRP